MKRVERLFALAEHLRGRRTGTTASALAERFGVGVRTIYRDLDALRVADLPIIAERGRGGGVALDRSYTLPPVNFNGREAAVLVASMEWLLQAKIVPLVGAAEAALDKVRSALPIAGQRELARVRAALRFTGVPAQSCSEAVRLEVERAWFEGLVLRVEYAGSNGPSHRRIRLRNIVMTRSETLLNCDDLDLGAPRQFLLHRVVAARCLGSHQPFEA